MFWNPLAIRCPWTLASQSTINQHPSPLPMRLASPRYLLQALARLPRWTVGVGNQPKKTHRINKLWSWHVMTHPYQSVAGCCRVSEKMSWFRVKDQAPNRLISSQPSKGLIRRLCRLFSNLQILSYLLPKLLPWQLCLISKHQRSSNWDCPKNAVPIFNCFIHSCIIIVPRNLQFWGIPKVYLYWAHPLGLWIMVDACWCIIVQQCPACEDRHSHCTRLESLVALPWSGPFNGDTTCTKNIVQCQPGPTNMKTYYEEKWWCDLKTWWNYSNL